MPASFDIPQHWGMVIPFHWKNGCLFSWQYSGKIATRSQCGQDNVVESITPIHSDRLYLDLGANDGVNGSSTYLLEKRGWRGMLVEPNVNLIPSLVNHRKNACVMACAVGNCREVMTLQTSECHTLGTLVSDETSYQFKRLCAESEGMHNVKKLPVPVLTTQDILDSFCDVFNLSPDFLKIDVEGFERLVVEDLLKTSHRPPIIEIENNERTDEVANILLSEGYTLNVVMDSFVEIWTIYNCDKRKIYNLIR